MGYPRGLRVQDGEEGVTKELVRRGRLAKAEHTFRVQDDSFPCEA